MVALNFCYDVPVKLYSSNLLAMAVFLAAGDVKRLVNVLVLNSTAPQARPQRPTIRTALDADRGDGVLDRVRGLSTRAPNPFGWLRYEQTYVYAPRPLFGGAYEVESFRADGRDVPPLITEGTKMAESRVRASVRYGADGEQFAARLPGELPPRTPIRLH